MRRLNSFLTIGILVTLIIHSVMGALRLAGSDADPQKMVARISVVLICAHIVVTLILTAQTLHARRMSGAGYVKDNLLFWVRRISGLAILPPLAAHLLIFMTPPQGDAFRLQVFTTGRLISQILMVITIAVHVLTNIRPLMISLGVRGHKHILIDILLIISVLLLFFAAAFLIYYLRWMSL